MGKRHNLSGRYVWIDGDIYQIEDHHTGLMYSARFHAGYSGDADPGEPLDMVTVTNYHGDGSLWPFDGHTLKGELL